MHLSSEKTAKRKRMLVTGEDGTTKVVRKRDPRGFCCSKCGAEDSTRWRRFDERTVHCKSSIATYVCIYQRDLFLVLGEKCVRNRRWTTPPPLSISSFFFLSFANLTC